MEPCLDKFSWLALRAAEGVGPVLFRRLLERFETPAAVLAADNSQLSAVRGVTQTVCASIAGPDCRRFAERELRQLEGSGIRLISFLDSGYPKQLFEIGDPPPLLYLRGEIPDWEPAVAVVGSRKASIAGRNAAEKLSAGLAERGVLVVSGLARGIDTAAHRGAVAGGGKTVAVLGSGVDSPYPSENLKLAEQIVSSGCLISEFPLGTLPLAEHFPRRNRIISGLSRGVLVVEAEEKSGSLITARYALDQGREVMAVPGPINASASRGPNRLIKEGAALVDCVDDILIATGLADHAVADPSGPDTSGMTKKQFSLTPVEAAVYELVARGAVHIDELTAALELTPGEVSAMVLSLELKGAVIQLPGSYYSIH